MSKIQLIFKDVNFDEFNKEVSRGKYPQRFQNWALESAKIEIRETSQGNQGEVASELAGAQKEPHLTILILRKKSWPSVSNVAKN